MAEEEVGRSLGGISSWEDQAIPAHLPSAIKGLGPIERAQWFAKQREKERVEGEQLRAERSKALQSSSERVKKGVDDIFGDSGTETLEVRASHPTPNRGLLLRIAMTP